MDKLNNEIIELWLNEPVTKKFLEILKEHREANLDHLLNIGFIDQKRIGLIAQLKGQINTLDEILNTKEFIQEALKLEEENDEGV